MSEDKKSNKLVILLFILICGACIYAGSQLFPKVITSIQYDTTYVEKRIEVPIEKIVYRHLPAKLDTIWRNQDERTPFEHPERDIVAKLDTVLTSSADSQHLAYKDTVQVHYHFPPLNYFDLSVGFQQRQVIVQEKYITKTVEIEKSKLFDFSFGGLLKDVALVAGGYLLCDLTHKNQVEYRYGVTIPINYGRK